MIRIPRPAFVFLDFDGVIMDSMGLKLDSYCHAFEGCGFAREDRRMGHDLLTGLVIVRA